MEHEEGTAPSRLPSLWTLFFVAVLVVVWRRVARIAGVDSVDSVDRVAGIAFRFVGLHEFRDFVAGVFGLIG
jgi:hypothetical protein